MGGLGIDKKRLLRTNLLLKIFLIVLFTSFAVDAQNPSISSSVEETSTETVLLEEIVEPQLAETVNDRPINTPYIQEYLSRRNYFDNIHYKKIEQDSSAHLEEGHKIPEDVQGFLIDNKKYAIHLIICEEEFKACYFRINGVPTGKLVSRDDKSRRAQKSFSLDGEHHLEITSMTFNYCGGRRFCDIYWDEKDIVEVEIIKKEPKKGFGGWIRGLFN